MIDDGFPGGRRLVSRGNRLGPGLEPFLRDCGLRLSPIRLRLGARGVLGSDAVDATALPLFRRRLGEELLGRRQAAFGRRPLGELGHAELGRERFLGRQPDSLGLEPLLLEIGGAEGLFLHLHPGLGRVDDRELEILVGREQEYLGAVGNEEVVLVVDVLLDAAALDMGEAGLAVLVYDGEEHSSPALPSRRCRR